MKARNFLYCFFIALFLLFSGDPTIAKEREAPSSFYNLEAHTLAGKVTSFENYKGKVLLVTNIALQCGTTPQLHALQKLYEQHSDDGLTVLGFPSNDFTGEDTSKPKKIKEACKKNFGVTFPLFRPASVVGDDKQKVFSFLTTSGSEDIQGEVAFNFEKFLIDKEGKVRERYGPFTGAQSEVVKTRIKELLEE